MWGYNLFYEDTQLTNRDEDDCEFETEAECYEDAEYEIDETIKYWKSEGSWRPENGDSRDYFSVEPFECDDEQEELEEFEACTAVPVRSSTYSLVDDVSPINASMRIENMYDVKTELEELISSLSIIEDTYFKIKKTDPRYILKTYLYHVSRHLQAAYNNACEFIERDN